MNKKEIKQTLLNSNLNKIITVGLLVALILMVAGFLVNAARNNVALDIEELEENTLGLKELYNTLKSTGNSIIFLLSYLGIFILILVPVAGVIFTLAYFTSRKNLKLSLISTGVLLILILSAVIGFIRI
jgi:uncharacterized membrane protein